MSVIDLFAGPGGWDVAARELGMDPLGIEWDDAACATREAAGLRTVQADVSKLQTHAFLHEHTPKVFGRRKGHEPVVGLIASPPCQAWSTAGRGGGRRDREHVISCLGELAAGSDTRAWHRAKCEDERSMLVVEPLRWALDLEPEWIALEQVPPVLELWSMVAQILTLKGYSTWTGVLEAERYGVPQTRERAILMARRDGFVHPPAPTHQRYVPGEPQRHDVTFDGEVLPWVSMAEALGWGMSARPSLTITTPNRAGAATHVLGGGSGSDRAIARARDGGGWVDGPEPAPAPTVTGGGTASGGVEVFASRSARERVRRSVVYRNGNQARAAERPLDTPAPALHFGHASNAVEWVVRTGNFTAVKRDADGDRSKDGSVPYERSVDAPAPVVTGNVDRWTARPSTVACGCDSGMVDADGFCACCHAHLDDPDGLYAVQGDGTHTLADCPSRTVGRWRDRPATTIAGDPRIAPPGHHDRQMNDATRVTVQEAATLQTFPPDYPWQGDQAKPNSKGKQYEMVGNAIPPVLAHAVLSVLAVAESLERAA